jgi:hypothetical protein
MPLSFTLSVLILMMTVLSSVQSDAAAGDKSWKSSLKLGGGSLVPPPKHKIKPMDELMSEDEEDDVHVTAQYIAETNLPTDLGMFRLRAYRTPQSPNQFVGTEPCVIYSAEKSPFGKKWTFVGRCTCTSTRSVLYK